MILTRDDVQDMDYRNPGRQQRDISLTLLTIPLQATRMNQGFEMSLHHPLHQFPQGSCLSILNNKIHGQSLNGKVVVCHCRPVLQAPLPLSPTDCPLPLTCHHYSCPCSPEVHCLCACRFGCTQSPPSWDTGQCLESQGANRFTATTISGCSHLYLGTLARNWRSSAGDSVGSATPGVFLLGMLVTTILLLLHRVATQCEHIPSDLCKLDQN